MMGGFFVIEPDMKLRRCDMTTGQLTPPEKLWRAITIGIQGNCIRGNQTISTRSA